MSRRLCLAGVILTVAIWLGVLLTPQLRLLLHSQIKPVQNPAEMQRQSKEPLDELAREYPDDPRVLAANLENIGDGIMTSGYQKSRLRQYDGLIEKFPREEWLIQNRLRLSTVGGFAIDVGEFVPPQYRQYGKPWLSRPEILQALKIAERGARLNPQNSFYDWMRAIFLFSLKRNEEALRALQQGAHKTHYDDGVLRDMQLRVEVQMLLRPLLSEERYAILAATILPHYAAMNSANRAAVWHGALAERKGEHQRALEIYGDQMKLAAVMRRDSTLMISLLVAERLSRVAWGSLKRRIAEEEPAEPTQEEVRRQTQTLSRTFADYARRHGRPELAELALNQAALFGTMDLIPWINSSTFLELNAGEIYRWKWLGTICLRALFWCGIGWIIIIGLQRVRRKRKVEKAEVASEFDGIAATLFVAFAFGIILFTAWRTINLQTLEQWILYGKLSPQISATVDVQGQALIQFFDRWLPFVPLTLAVFYSVVAALWGGRKVRSTPVALSQAGCVFSAFAFILILVGTVFFSLQQIQFVRQMALDIWAIERWLPLFAPVFVALLLALYLGLRFGHAWLFGLSRAFQRLQSTQLLPQSLFLLIVILSGAYLITSVLSLPLRSEADARLDDFIARGEVAVLHDVAQNRR